MKQFTVEPVPTPSVAPRATCSRAASAARRFFASASAIIAVPQKRLCPREPRAQYLEYDSAAASGRRVKAYFFLAAFFLAFFFAFAMLALQLTG